MGARGRRAWLAVCIALLAALVAPSPSSARDSRFVFSGYRSTTFTLQGSHGYKIAVESNRQGSVTLTASKQSVAASYSVHGRISLRRIEANFGKLGKISVSFHSSGAKRKGESFLPPRLCSGRPGITEFGTFRGIVKFRGERGYTTVRTTRAKGKIVKSPRQVCRYGGGNLNSHLLRRAKAPDAAGLSAVARSKKRIVFFHAFKEEPSPKPLFIAITKEKRGRIEIARLALVGGSARTFVTSEDTDDPMAFATVTPASPFGGTGTFQRQGASPPSWTGNLNVRLPGRRKLSLTGSAFTTKLCRELLCGFNFGGKKARISTSVGPSDFYDSGSQSQLFGDTRLSWSR
jgi:hypothetical protein